MRLFITGANGFIGRHVVRTALKSGHEVVGLWYPGHVDPQERRTGLTWVEGGLDTDLREQLAGCQVLIHLAAHGVLQQQGNSDWDASFHWNVTASLKLWRAALAAGVEHLVVCGSCFEYGRSAERYRRIPPDAPLEPANAYAASKAAASMAAMGLAVEQSARVSILRPFHVFGEGEHPSRFWPALRRAALAREDFPMTPGAQVRDFIPVEQVAARFIARATGEWPERGLPITENVGTGRPQTLLQFARHWWSQWNARGQLRPGAIAYRPNEVMSYVPLVVSSAPGRAPAP